MRDGKLLEVHCGNCRPERHLWPERHLYIQAGSLGLPKRMPVPEGVQASRLQQVWWRMAGMPDVLPRLSLPAMEG